MISDIQDIAYSEMIGVNISTYIL